MDSFFVQDRLGRVWGTVSIDSDPTQTVSGCFRPTPDFEYLRARFEEYEAVLAGGVPNIETLGEQYDWMVSLRPTLVPADGDCIDLVCAFVTRVDGARIDGRAARMNDTPTDHKQQVQRFYTELWDDHDLGVSASLLTPECRFRGSLGQEKRGHEGIANYIDMIHTALGDYRCRIDELVAEGPRVFAKMFFTGIHRAEFMGYPGTGHALGWHGAALFTFEDALIDEIWVLGDVYDLLQQLTSNAGSARV